MWKKAKDALGLNLCVFEPRTRDEEFLRLGTGRTSDASTVMAGASMAAAGGGSDSGLLSLMPISSTPTSSCLRLSKSGSRSYKKTCAICLESMKAGHGALFTGECSHAFHFNCIASNVKFGNCVCPICRAKWKEIPFLGPPLSDLPHMRARVNPAHWPQEDGTITLLRRLPRTDLSNRQHQLSSLLTISEPNVYDDDEPVGFQSEVPEHGLTGTIDVKAYPEYSAIPKMASEESFSILIHLKAPCGNQNASLIANHPSRAPIDLVTVLDISGSMAGTKLALLKRAMGFVIQNLGPSDRLSVIAFSSTARRLLPLRRMTESGRQHVLQAVNSLVSSGGTNIAEGLRKGAKVIEERKEKNSVCSIILLSDGQDTYTVSSSGSGVNRSPPDYQSLVPSSIRCNAGHQVPVHAFGFGTDHDSFSMHSISEISGGTFSFIESECTIQDAFAQCIGGLLSVVVQELIVEVECLYPGIQLAPIRSGSYANQVVDGLKGSISVGDLYADEERDFLVSVNVPPVTDEEIALLKVGCSYRDPLSKEMVNLNGEDVRIRRPEAVSERDLSIEVDRERNRICAAETISEARAAAERGALSEAVSILEARRVILSESLAGQSGDHLCAALNAELREMQERMESRQRYEESGRAYVLSGLSSHSWQRATARGNSTDSATLLHSYQTPSMVDMLQRSQTLCPSPRPSRPPIRPARSFPCRPDPR
ncbi:uncharacterized protein LOC110032909 [Phalaenopsis equestris]|uniref:uncharacterized protein LOC110032909 n=1 Tax=Phalaenopsis equestris TaxID=78828 RepID=UPI0009E40301|nr:uncharacterized protein LOC110032909 [Phalaenopsis equestris]